MLPNHNLSRRLSPTEAGTPVSTGARRLRASASLKLIMLAAITMMVVIAAQTFINIDNAQRQITQTEQQRLFTLYDDYRLQVAEHTESASALSMAFADRPDVRALFSARQREALLTLLSPLYTQLKTRQNIVQFNLEEPNGTVFLRVNQPARFGDDVTYRRSVADTMTTHQMSAGIEIGPNRLGVRSVSPIFDQNQFIGMVEIGVDYDDNFIDQLRRRTGADYRMWVSYEAAKPAGLKQLTEGLAAPIPQVFYYTGSAPLVPYAPGEAYQRVLQSGQPEVHTVSTSDGTWGILLEPMQAYGGRTIGVVEFITSQTAAINALQRSQFTALAIAGSLALLGFALMWVSTNFVVLRPLQHLTDVARRQAGGELSARASLRTSDEFQELGTAMNTMTAQLRDLIGSLEQHVQARTDQLQASADVGRVAASTLDTDTLLRTIVNLITDRFGFYYTAVFTVDDTGKWAVLREATGEAGRILKQRHHQLPSGGQSMVGAVLSTRQARIALDVGEEAVRFANPMLPGTRSEIALPLIVGDRILGVLDVQSTQEAAFGESNAAVLQSMADQIAIALSNAEQFKETQIALTRAGDLYRASHAIAEAQDAPGVLHSLITHLAPEAKRAAIILFGPQQPDGQYAYLTFAAAWVGPGFENAVPAITPGIHYPTEQFPIVKHVASGKPIAIPDVNVMSVDPAMRTWMRQFGAEAVTGFPLAVSQRYLGVIVIGYHTPRQFSSEHIQSLTALSSQAAIALQNQQLLAETQAALNQLDEINRRLTRQAWHEFAHPAGGTLRLIDARPGVPANASVSGDHGLRAPIVLRGETIGSLSLQDIDANRAWTPHEIAMLNAVANEIAIAVENARLLEQTEQRAQRERLVSEIGRKMLAASDMRGILRAATDELGRALRLSHAEVRLGSDQLESISGITLADSNSQEMTS